MFCFEIVLKFFLILTSTRKSCCPLCHLVYCRAECLSTILTKLSSTIDRDANKNVVNVVREDVLDGAFRALARKQFDPSRLLTVRFAGEDGIDSGGLTREFFRLAMQAIKSSSIWHGNDDRKFVRLDYGGLFNALISIMTLPIMLFVKLLFNLFTCVQITSLNNS